MQQKETIFDEEMFADADTLEGVDVESGKQLAGLVRQFNTVQQQIDDAEQHIKALKEEKQRIAFEQIPMLMDEMGMERIDVDGAIVKLKSFVSLLTGSRRLSTGSENMVMRESSRMKLLCLLAKVKTTPQAMSCTSLKRRAFTQNRRRTSIR